MKGSILIVEDECFGESFKKIFEEENYFVILYKNGLEAIDQIENGLIYELAIIDLSLPLIDGEEVIKTSKEINPNIPVLSFSGYSHKPKNSDRHITKPIFTEDLIKIIDDYFSKKEL